MANEKVLLVDDEQEFTQLFTERLTELPDLQKTFEVESLAEDDFRRCMKILNTRQRAHRKDGGCSRRPVDIHR